MADRDGPGPVIIDEQPIGGRLTHKGAGPPLDSLDERASTQLVLLEYTRSSELCNHVDDVRNVITSFFLTLVAGTAVAVSRYADGSLRVSRVGTPEQVVTAVCLGVGILGTLFVLTLARLRRVQLERYQLMNAILDAFITPPERYLVPFGQASVPLPGRKKAMSVRVTGSYFWTMVIVMPTAAVTGVMMLVILSPHRFSTLLRTMLAAVVAALVLAALDAAYQRLSHPGSAPVLLDTPTSSHHNTATQQHGNRS